MKYSTLIFVFLILIFTSCVKDKQTRITTCEQSGEYDYLNNYKIGAICTSDICTEYQTIWQELMQENNNLSSDFFNTHFELSKSNVNSWRKGISYRVCYKFKVGWAVAYDCDSFIIKIDADNTSNPSYGLPKDIYLTKEKIKIAVDNKAFSSRLTKIAAADDLKFTTMEEALNELIEFSGVNQLCLNQIIINDDNGNLILEASARYDNEENSCIMGTIDLITGEKHVNETPCLIN